MSESSHDDRVPGREPVLDCLGIGFGPSNLAMTIETTDRRAAGQSSIEDFYLDARESFSWHPGMLLDESRLQVVFLKDLATMRNPRSPYTFLNYLHCKGRLHKFINLRTFYPTRIEFDDYYRWVAQQFDAKVAYRRRVMRIDAVPGQDGGVRLLEVTAENLDTGAPEVYYARNLSLGTGGAPRIPAGIQVTEGGRVFHSGDTLDGLRRHCPDPQGPYRIVVVGSGQTAADVLQYVINHYPNARISSHLRGFAFKPQDDTHFVNELFFPETVDLLYGMPPRKRQELLNRHRDVTHSAVDMDLLPVLYDALYNDEATGRHRLSLHRFHELAAVDQEDGRVGAVFRDLHHEGVGATVKADVVILATGYERDSQLRLLDEIAPYLQLEAQGNEQMARLYYLHRRPGFEPKVYLQGFCEATHGFSEVLLSLMPIRAAEIVSDILGEAWTDVPGASAPGEVEAPILVSAGG